MFLVISEQPTYFAPVFEPDYETGSHGEINPLTGAVYGAFGLTIIDYEKRSAALIRLSERTHVKGAAYQNKRKFPPAPEPDFVEDFPPEDTRGIVAVFVYPEKFNLQSGAAQDLTLEVIMGNKTPTDLMVTLEALDLTPETGEMTLVLSQSNFLLASGTEAVLLLAVRLSDTIVGTKTIQVGGEAAYGIMVQPGDCVLNIQPINAPAVFYQVNGPETYILNIGDSLDIPFTTSNGMGGEELWEFSDPMFLQDHNLAFTELGVLMSTGVAGPAGLFEMVVFVEQNTNFGTKIFSSKIIEIAVV